MRVLVVEDDPAIGQLVRHVFERDGQDVVHAATGTQGLSMMRSWQPDVVVLDLGLPDINGLEVARKIRSESDVPIVILTAQGMEHDRVNGLDLGADDYVVKPFSVHELAARIRAVTRRSRGQLVPPADAALLHNDLKLDPGECRVFRDDEEISLTKREFEILRMLMQQPGKLVTRSAIAHAVWSRSADSARNLLDVHMTALRKKLDDRIDGPRYIETVRGEGFRLAG